MEDVDYTLFSWFYNKYFCVEGLAGRDVPDVLDRMGVAAMDKTNYQLDTTKLWRKRVEAFVE